MNDASTNQSQSADGGQIAVGHGKHRGPVSRQDATTAPRGRHRRPAGENEHAGSAA
ncbi:hypothetical protein [Streptomyces prasinopilosus]|uniref:Uncharacterized protein n=1 Tax=Streptomyces prasinopilosus TaxID=67344 RepID=A0A1G6JGV2_9ACTN|nr:hypothetical protein [Streptomyces prasinopilosus]SDC17893.1 hypothetical protein SAMN05216505_101671 [Streptomyces prasinopilosus]